MNIAFFNVFVNFLFSAYIYLIARDNITLCLCIIVLMANWFKSLFTFLSLCVLMCYSRSGGEPSGHTAWKIIHHPTTVNFLLACRCQAVLLMRCIPALKPVRQIGPPASAVHHGQRPSTALQAIRHSSVTLFPSCSTAAYLVLHPPLHVRHPHRSVNPIQI